MTAQPVEPDLEATYYQLRDLADEITATADRRGTRVRAAIADQGINVIMMSPSTRHGRIVSLLTLQIEGQDAHAATMAETRVEHPGLGLCRTADLLAMSQDAFEAQDDDAAAFAPTVDLAVEVVSRSNPGNDYMVKLREYPRMGVPAYVIIDPRDGTISVHSDPDTISKEPQYRTRKRYAFGDTVPMGRWSIDTARFPRYREE
ncbi:Uma2 family endonuclease [Streptomyces sp. NPDC008121]|uniref:Uma2 family endonuclease n=1 Tax=Streptomyces sp. NPDC008121 TaxID=3364809 RepID=UPI0036E762D5